MSFAALFPGQGSQQLNMGRALLDRYQWARDLVSVADEIQSETDRPAVSSAMFPEVDRATDQKEIEALRNAPFEDLAAVPCIGERLARLIRERLA